MAINAYGDNLATNGIVGTPTTTVEDKSALGKDDFMALLLVEMQHQDPTDPMDTEKVLAQTTQLATLESSENTNNALESLAAQLGSTQQFSTISAIGKTADLGSNAVAYDTGSTSTFEVYFPEAIKDGNVEILDTEGNILSRIPVEENAAGTYQFDWDGKLADGSVAESGVYYVTASYNNPDGKALTTRMGSYPIESVRFEEGGTLVKVGSSYVPMENIKEIY